MRCKIKDKEQEANEIKETHESQENKKIKTKG